MVAKTRVAAVRGMRKPGLSAGSWSRTVVENNTIVCLKPLIHQSLRAPTEGIMSGTPITDVGFKVPRHTPASNANLPVNVDSAARPCREQASPEVRHYLAEWQNVLWKLGPGLDCHVT